MDVIGQKGPLHTWAYFFYLSLLLVRFLIHLENTWCTYLNILYLNPWDPMRTTNLQTSLKQMWFWVAHHCAGFHSKMAGRCGQNHNHSWVEGKCGFLSQPYRKKGIYDMKCIYRYIQYLTVYTYTYIYIYTYIYRSYIYIYLYICAWGTHSVSQTRHLKSTNQAEHHSTQKMLSICFPSVPTVPSQCHKRYPTISSVCASFCLQLCWFYMMIWIMP